MAEPYKKSGIRDTFESLVVTVILAIFGTTFVLQAFKIPTGSMETTLLIGDHLLVNKFAFAYQPGGLRRLLPYRAPQRGDVLVFKFPGSDEAQEPGEHYVKRIIGVPGDRIRIAAREVFVNGQPLPEPHVHHDHVGEVWPGDDFPLAAPAYAANATLRWSAELPDHVQGGELVVPPGHYFAMGDNREHSWDSRFWGFVPEELVAGRPIVIYWSYQTPPDEYQHNTPRDRVLQMLDLIVHFPTHSRWRRTLRLVH